MAVIGNSIDNEKGTGGVIPWALAFIGHRINIAPYGYQTHGGDTISDYVDRANAAIANRPRCIIVGGGENDANKGDSGPTTAAARTAILDAITTVGTSVKLVILATTIVPTGLNQTKIDTAAADNLAVRALDNTRYNGVLIRVDDRAAVRSGGDSYSDGQGNGIHNSAMGAAVLGSRLALLLRPYIGGDPPIMFGLTETSGNLNTAFDFAGTGGTVPGTMSGQIGDGWVGVNGSGAAVVASKGFMADGVTPAQVLTISGMASSTSAISLTRSIAGLHQVGTYHSRRCLVEITAADGSRPVGLGAIGINAAGTPAGSEFWDTGAAATGKPPVPGPVKYGSQIYDTVAAAALGLSDYVPAMRGVEALAATTVATATMVLNMRLVVGPVDIIVKFARAEWFLEETVAYAAPYHQSATRTRPSDGSSYNLFQGPTLTGSGNSRTARLAACSGGNLSYAFQWRNGSGDIVGANNQLYDSGGVAGTYYCRQTISNSFGSIQVDSASFTI